MCQPSKDSGRASAECFEYNTLASELLERAEYAREVSIGHAAIASSLAESLATEYVHNFAHAAKIAYIVAHITERRAAAGAADDNVGDSLERCRRAAFIARLLRDSLVHALEENLEDINDAIVVEHERTADLTAALERRNERDTTTVTRKGRRGPSTRAPPSRTTSTMTLFPVDVRDDGDVRASSARSEAVDGSAVWLRMNSFRASANDARVDGDVVCAARARSTSPSASSRDDDWRERREKKSKRAKAARGEKKRERREKRLRVDNDEARKIAALEENYGSRTRDARVGDVRMRQGRGAYEDSRRDGDNLAYGRVALADSVKFRRAVDQAREWYERAANVRKNDFYGLKLTSKRDLDSTKERYFKQGTSSRSDRNTPRLRKPPLVKTAKENENAEEFVKLESCSANNSHVAEEGLENAHASLMQRTKIFNEKTRERPEDVELWIEFAQFQDEFMSLTRKRSEIRQLIEKKIAILEQALRHHSHNARLIIMLLTEYEKVEESPSIKSRWHYALEQNNGNADIWHAYLRYRMRDFSNFNASGVRSDFNRALSSLAIARNQLKRNAASPSKISELERAIVDIIIDVCRFDIQTGETELAVARIQAAIEFCCLSPSTQTEDELVDAFEQFWECGEPRIGEPNATGWGGWMSMNIELKTSVHAGASRKKHANPTPCDVPPPPPSPPDGQAGVIHGSSWEYFEDATLNDEDDCGTNDEDQDEELDAAALARLQEQLDGAADVEIDDDILHRWVVKELERSRKIWRPARSMDVRDDEPGASLPRVIWFDDIRYGLIRLCDESTKRRLWLQTLRLIGISDKDPTDFDHEKSLDFIESTSGLCENALQVFTSVDGVRHDGSWLSQSGGLEDAWFTAEAGRGALGANMFRVFARYDPTVFSCRVVKTKDVAKELLSGAHENSLKLWSHFAKMEWESGRKVSARKVYARVFKTAVSAKAHDITHVALSWVECELRADEHENALQVLFALASIDSGKEITPDAAHVKGATEFLQAHRLFKQKMHHAFSGGAVWKGHGYDGLQGHGVALIQCFAHFQYLNKQTCKDIDDAIRAVPATTQLRETNVEHWHALHVKLLDMKPLVARRSSLECALQIFPRSPHLLLKMCELELNVHGKQRMRRLLDIELERNPNVTLLYYTLGLEVSRPFASNPRVISVLERALQPALITAQSPLLWLAYMRAYVSCGQISSAKTVFLRAINAVPWNKTIWLYGMQLLATAFSTKERAALIDVMRGKGISLRTDVFEIQLERAVETK